MAKYSFSSIDKAEIEIDGYTFEVYGLSRQDALEFTTKALEIAKIEDLEEKEKASKELDEMLLRLAIPDEKGRELVNKASLKVYRQIVDIIMELSGLTGEVEKK